MFAAATAITVDQSRDFYLAIITAVIVAIIGPLLLGLFQSRARNRERAADWARQDTRDAAQRAAAEEVARKAETTAQLLVMRQQEAKRAAELVAQKAATAAELLQAAQEETIARTDEVARIAKEGSDSQALQLKQIHKLVNNDMTEARRNELHALEDALHALERTLELDNERGIDPSPEDLVAVAAKRNRVAELKTVLAERAKQQAKSDGLAMDASRATGREPAEDGGLEEST